MPGAAHSTEEGEHSIAEAGRSMPGVAHSTEEAGRSMMEGVDDKCYSPNGHRSNGLLQEQSSLECRSQQ